MQYITNAAIILKGDRVPPSTVIEIDTEMAEALGEDVSPVGATTAPVVEAEPEKDLEDMSLEELKAKAKALGIKATGSKADLVERLSLAVEPEELPE